MEAEDAAERTVAAGAEGRIQNELTYEKKGRGIPVNQVKRGRNTHLVPVQPNSFLHFVRHQVASLFSTKSQYV